MYCENAKKNEKGIDYEIKNYTPSNLNLQKIAQNLKSSTEDSANTPPWLNYLRDGLNLLMGQPEPDFRPPHTDTDKLYMNIGDRDLIEVAHPVPQDSSLKR